MGSRNDRSSFPFDLFRSDKVPIRNNRHESHQAVIESNIEGSALKKKFILLPCASTSIAVLLSENDGSNRQALFCMEQNEWYRRMRVAPGFGIYKGVFPGFLDRSPLMRFAKCFRRQLIKSLVTSTNTRVASVHFFSGKHAAMIV